MMLRNINASLTRFATLLFVLAATPQMIRSQTPDPCPRNSDEKEIVNAVFRYEMWQHSQKREWKVFYLAFGWLGQSTATDDCVDAWLNAFNEHTPPVRKFSRADFDADRLTKERGLVLGIADIAKRSQSEAEVEGYAFVVPGEAQGYRYYLIREDGKWIVKSSKATWIA